jgi:transposase
MKKPKIEFYIGLDVHKAFTAYAVRNKEGKNVIEGSCASTPQDLKANLEPYMFSCVLGLETNAEIYPIYNGFKEKYDIRVANTIQLRTLVGKNDQLDAIRLSDMLRLGTFPCSYIPDEKISQLRILVKIRHGFMEESAKLQLKIKSIIRKLGLPMSTARSFTKKWCYVLGHHIAFNPNGFQLRHLYDTYTYIEKKLEISENEMIEFAKINFTNEFKAIINIKGIGPVITSYLISEICPISRFKNIKKLRRYAGVIPVTQESAGKIYGTYIPKTSSRKLLRYALVAAANCMNKHNENVKKYYTKKKKQKKIHGKAIMPVARSISDMIYKTLNALEA